LINKPFQGRLELNRLSLLLFSPRLLASFLRSAQSIALRLTYQLK